MDGWIVIDTSKTYLERDREIFFYLVAEYF